MRAYVGGGQAYRRLRLRSVPRRVRHLSLSSARDRWCILVAEAEHVAGEEGVLSAKRFLESTTYVNITFTVYDDDVQTTLTGLDGLRKTFDLTGFFLGDDRRPLFVEVKNYNAVGDQASEYTKFLATAYSVTADGIERHLDRRTEFMWATWHPFSQTKWPRLTSEEEIRDALRAHPEMARNSVDEQIVRRVAQRLWLVPMHRRQDELLMTRDELLTVYKALGRKGIA
jgi:hypothetical protein